MKGSKLKKVEIKISIDNIKVEDAKMKVYLLSDLQVTDLS